MNALTKKREELRKRIDEAPGRVGFDTQMGHEIADYARQRRAMGASWETIAKELTTATWMVQDCVERSDKAKARKRKRRRKKARQLFIVSIEVLCPRCHGSRIDGHSRALRVVSGKDSGAGKLSRGQGAGEGEQR